MASGLLLDTHVLYWLVRRDPMDVAALDSIARAQDQRILYVSPITAWELGVAVRKRDNQPDLGAGPDAWFRQALRSIRAKLATITLAVASEAAAVPGVFGRGDPGDCFLIATARVRRLALVTRDGPMLHLAAARPCYLTTIMA